MYITFHIKCITNSVFSLLYLWLLILVNMKAASEIHCCLRADMSGCECEPMEKGKVYFVNCTAYRSPYDRFLKTKKDTQLVHHSEKISQYELFRFNIVRVSLPNCETILPLSSFVKTTFFFPQQSINIQLLSHAHSFFFDHSPLKVGKTRWWHPPPNSWDSPPLPQGPTGVKTSGASGREIHPQSHQSAVDPHHISSGAVHR